MTDFGGKDKSFTNVYPIRYPGTWDTNEAQRKEDEPESGPRRAGPSWNPSWCGIRPRRRRSAGMPPCDDDDGGLSLIAAGIRTVTSADEKQDQLQQGNRRSGEPAAAIGPQLGRRSRRQPRPRKTHRRGPQVLDWLAADQEAVYHRVTPCRKRCASKRGTRCSSSDCGDTRAARSRRHPAPATPRPSCTNGRPTAVPKRLGGTRRRRPEGGPVAGRQRFQRLRPLLVRLPAHASTVFDDLLAAVGAGGESEDQGRGRPPPRAAEYVRIILNDYLLNPGPSLAPLPADEAAAAAGKTAAAGDFSRFGLMAPLVAPLGDGCPRPWPWAPASTCKLPPGNAS